MIVVVCLNPALDVTHHVPAVDWSGVNRPVEVCARPGGKGVNVARTLRALDADVLLMGLAGGITGAGVRAALGDLAVPAALTPIAAETRRTFTVVDGAGSAALFSEPGPRVTEREFAAFRGQYEQALDGAAAGNETGAGDAVVAALAHGLAIGRPWDERLRHAVALGAACAAAPVAGEYSHAVYVTALRTAAVCKDPRDEVG